MNAEQVEPWRQHAIELGCWCADQAGPCELHDWWNMGHEAGSVHGERTQDVLRAENERLRSHVWAFSNCAADTIAARNATIEDLRAALAPFVKCAPSVNRRPDTWPDDWPLQVRVATQPPIGDVVGEATVGDVRRAAALLDVPDRFDDVDVRAKTEED